MFVHVLRSHSNKNVEHKVCVTGVNKLPCIRVLRGHSNKNVEPKVCVTGVNELPCIHELVVLYCIYIECKEPGHNAGSKIWNIKYV